MVDPLSNRAASLSTQADLSPEVCSPPPPTSAPAVADQVSAYTCDSAALASGPFFDHSGLAVSPQQLELQTAKENAQSRALMEAGILSVFPELTQVAQSSGRDELTHSAREFTARATRSPEFAKVLASLPREQVQKAMALVVEDANPSASPTRVKELVAKLSGHVNEFVMVNTGKRLNEGVAHQLTSAAKGFERAANDPRELQQLATLCSNSGGAQGAQLRGSLGLTGGDRPVSPAEVKEALLQRAGLMRHEAERVDTAGVTTTYRNLLLHSAMGEHLLRDAGVKDGSWSSKGLQLVQARGESDEQAIHAAKLASAVVLGAASGGLGLGAAANALMVAGFNAPSVMSAWQGVDAARAGVSSGTADVTAETAAQRKAWLATGEMFLSAAVGAKLGAHALHGAPDVGLHALKDAGAEAAIGLTAGGVEHLLHPHRQGAQGDALSRARSAASK